jgi:hypothetical protein
MDTRRDSRVFPVGIVGAVIVGAVIVGAGLKGVIFIIKSLMSAETPYQKVT